MILQIFFTPDEIRRFFEENGFKVESRGFTEFRPAYHNRTECVEIDHEVVVFPSGKFIRADKLFEALAEYSLKRQIIQNNLETKRLIKLTFKKMTDDKGRIGMGF